MPTAFETFVNDELPNRVASQEASVAADSFPRYTGTAKLTTARTPAQLLADISAAKITLGTANPPTLAGSEGEFYWNTATDKLYVNMDGSTGWKEVTGQIGPPGADGQDGEEGPMGPPGQQGPAGAAGSTGATGPQGLQGLMGFGLDGADGEDAFPIPGPQGATGATGATGAQGPAGDGGGGSGGVGPPGMDGEDGGDGLLWFPPGQIVVPLRSIPLLAGAPLYPTDSAGCSLPTRVAYGATNKLNDWVLDFDATTEENAFARVILPPNYGEETFTAIVQWTAAVGTAAQTVQWKVALVSPADNTALDVAYGTAQVVSDALQTVNYEHITAATPAITCAGTPAAGKVMYVRVTRDVANDNLSGDVRLTSVKLEF